MALRPRHHVSLHSDTTRAVSQQPLVSLTCHEGWHCDPDTTKHCSVSIGQLISGVASGNASHDPHTVGTNERATPLAPRQVGVELVASRTLCGPSQWQDVQWAETSVAPVRKRLLLSRVLVPGITLRGCEPGRERSWNCERLTKVPPVADAILCGFVTKQDAKGERITTDLAFAGSRGASLQVVTEQSPPSSTSEPM